MRVAVVGGTGTIGALAVDELARRGHEAFVLSRHAPAVSTGAAYRQVDLTTGSGLPEALDGVEVTSCSPVSSTPSRGLAFSRAAPSRCNPSIPGKPPNS